MFDHIKNPKTRACAAQMMKHFLEFDNLVVATFSWAYGKTTAGTAIRYLRKMGLVEIDYIAWAGNPIYRSAPLTAHQKVAIRAA